MKIRGTKRLLTLLLSLALALSVFPLAALGTDSEVYELWIAGVQVTDDNRADILGDGVFRYNKRTNTLSVDGYCNCPSDYVIKSAISGLKIESAWDSTLIGNRGCVSLCADTILTGEKLTIQNTGNAFTALSVSTKLTILNAELYVEGSGLAMSGIADGHTQLEIVDSFVSSKTASTSKQEGAVRNFTGGITLEGCAITTPDDAFISNGTVTDRGGTPVKQVVIEPLNQRFELRLGDYLQMGSYYGAPILWRCVGVDGNGPLMLADKILCLKAFDAKTSSGGGSHARDPLGDRAQYGSNLWTDSTLRAWLNSDESAGAVAWSCGNPPAAAYVGGGLNAYDTEAGFLTNFTELELTAVKRVRQKCAVAEIDPYTEGWGPYAPTPAEDPPSPVSSGTLDGVLGNYASACSTQSTDRMFLLDPAQLSAVYDNGYALGYYYYIGQLSEAAAEHSEYRSEGVCALSEWQSWLRTPVTDTGASVWAVYPNGTVASEGRDGHAFDSEYGVRPAFYLDTAAAVGQGRGTAENPYVVFEEPEAQPTPTPRPTPPPELSVQATKTELSVGETATLSVSAANIDPAYKLSWIVQQPRVVVKLTPYGGAKAHVSACAAGTAEITVQATIQGKIVAEKTVTVTVLPAPPTPTATPQPTPGPDFTSVSLGNGTLYLYNGRDYLQGLTIHTDTGKAIYRGEIQVKTYRLLRTGDYQESSDIVRAGTATTNAGNLYIWVQGNAVGSGRVSLRVKNSKGTWCECSRDVTVTEPGSGVSGFSIHLQDEEKLYPGSFTRLKLDIQPAGALYRLLTFTSEDPDVAVVDPSGQILCKSPGQATIRAEIRNYGANSRYKYASLQIQVYSQRDYTETYGFSFSNNRTSFGYPEGYEFPQSLYEAAGMSRAKAWFKSASDWDGNCVGMNVTSLLFYLGKLNSALYSNRSDGATTYLPHSLKAPNTMSEADCDLRRTIELFQVAQGVWYDKNYLTLVSASSSFQPERLRDMASSVQRGEPVVLSLRTSWHYVGGNGHAVLLYDYAYKSSPKEQHIFQVYDPSHFVDTLTFTKEGGAWKFQFHYTDDAYTWYPLAYYSLSTIMDGYRYLRDHAHAVSHGARYADLFEEEDAHEAQFGEALSVTLPEGDYTLADAEGRTLTVTGGVLTGELEGVRLESETLLADAMEYTLTLPLGEYALTGSGAGTVSYTVCDDVNAVELLVPAAATVHFSSELNRLGVSHGTPFAYSIRFVAFDSAFDYLRLSGTAQSRVDAVLKGWEAEVWGADTLCAGVTVCGSEVERSIRQLSGSAVSVRISDERALGLWMGGEQISEETPLPERTDTMMPTGDLPGGAYDSPQTLRLEAADDETVIHYTTDGSAPTGTSPVYVLPIPVNRSVTVRAVACKFGYRDSSELRMDYTFPEPAAPTADTCGGHYVDTQYVRLSADDRILYTLDGSDPALYGTVYTRRLVIGGDTLLRAVCLDANGVCGSELREEYRFTRRFPVDTAALLTDGQNEPTPELAQAAKITFTLASYAELAEANIFLAYYDAGGKCLSVSTAQADLSYGTDSVTLPLEKLDDTAAIKVFFCNETFAPIAAVYDLTQAEGE